MCRREGGRDERTEDGRYIVRKGGREGRREGRSEDGWVECSERERARGGKGEREEGTDGRTDGRTEGRRD